MPDDNQTGRPRTVLYFMLNIGAVALLVIAGGTFALAAVEPTFHGMPALAAGAAVMASVLLGTSFLGRKVESLLAAVSRQNALHEEIRNNRQYYKMRLDSLTGAIMELTAIVRHQEAERERMTAAEIDRGVAQVRQVIAEVLGSAGDLAALRARVEELAAQQEEAVNGYAAGFVDGLITQAADADNGPQLRLIKQNPKTRGDERSSPGGRNS